MKKSKIITEDYDKINMLIQEAETDGWEAVSLTSTERYSHKVSVLMQRDASVVDENSRSNE